MEPFSPNWWRTTSLQTSQSSSIIDTAPELLGTAEQFCESPQSCSCPSLSAALTPLWHVRAAMMWTFLYIPPRARFIYSQPKALGLLRRGAFGAAVCTYSASCPLLASFPPPTHQVTGSDGACPTHIGFEDKQPSSASSDSPFACLLHLP